MTLISALLFSLVWGAVIWLAMLSAYHGGLARLCSPRIYLISILAVILPCALMLTGWTVPAAQTPSLAILDGGSDLEFLELPASVGRLVMEPGRNSADWLVWLVLSVYVAGLLVHLLVFARGFTRLASLLRGARPVHEFSVGRPVLRTSAPVAPFAVGGRHPCIVLPDAMISNWPQARLAMVAAHEEAHLRHRDPDIAFVLAFAVALFWFNPFVRDLVVRWRHACELRADAAVLRQATAETRKSYAETLLDAMRIANGFAANFLSPSFSHRSIRSDKMRISAILKGFEYSGRGLPRLIAHCAVLSLVAVGGAGALATSTGSLKSMDSFIPGGWVTSPFGVPRPFLRDHTGIDVAAQLRTPIAAPADAVVLQATDLFRGEPRWGKAVVLQFDDDLVVWFTHLHSYWVEPGDKVAKGTYFGTVGNTGLSKGPHVHIEAYRGAERVDPATVWPFLKVSKK
ncbi:M23/M56 family metallopeptidase [Hoeflea sp. TYP-13]|uniref:M23/M56 family metallopeptidase n=1 Tax=Hoeflea sp. TYP-13 TaxID=3230023 RepID=UPI0034C5FFB2